MKYIDAEVTNKKGKWLNDMEQLIKPILCKRIPGELNVDNVDSGAMNTDTYTMNLDSAGGVDKEKMR